MCGLIFFMQALCMIDLLKTDFAFIAKNLREKDSALFLALLCDRGRNSQLHGLFIAYCAADWNYMKTKQNNIELEKRK